MEKYINLTTFQEIKILISLVRASLRRKHLKV